MYRPPTLSTVPAERLAAAGRLDDREIPTGMKTRLGDLSARRTVSASSTRNGLPVRQRASPALHGLRAAYAPRIRAVHVVASFQPAQAPLANKLGRLRPWAGRGSGRTSRHCERFSVLRTKSRCKKSTRRKRGRQLNRHTLATGRVCRSGNRRHRGSNAKPPSHGPAGRRAAFGRMAVAHRCGPRQPPAGQLHCVATPGQQVQALAGADGRRIEHHDEPSRLSLSACHRDGPINYRGNADWEERNEPICLSFQDTSPNNKCQIPKRTSAGGQDQDG